MRKIEMLEAKFDRQFKVVFDALRELVNPTEKEWGRIGFRG